MQKFVILTTLLISLIASSCDIENGTLSDVITITSSSQVEIGRYSGEFTISYIANTTPEFSFSSDWLRIKSNNNGLATILYETNQTGGIRQAAVVLSNKSSKATVVVTQSNENVTPTITLIDESDIELDRCGQLVEINYTIENTNPEDYVLLRPQQSGYTLSTAKKIATKLSLA
jgi:hypothetical protein